MKEKLKVKDMMGYDVVLNFPPKKIVSLVPSQSELLWHLGLSDKLVGITKFCIHPADMKIKVEKIGGTKKLNINKIISLKPDLIIGNKEENEKSDITELKKHFPVWMSDIENLKDALKMIEEIGKITGKEKKSIEIISKIQSEKLKFSKKTEENSTSCVYFIWRNPYMVAGKNNFINSMLKVCGLKNVFDSRKFNKNSFENKNVRYPQINEDLLSTVEPNLILLSSEPYPFKEKHITELKTICPSALVKIVDGEMFSWYGSRLINSFKYFNSLLAEKEIKELNGKS
ncbi:MAG: helical backbone metal receptor [Bacteroidota bacterium]